MMGWAMGIFDMVAAALNMSASHGPTPVPTQAVGWSATTYVIAAVGGAILTAIAPFVLALLRFWPTMRKLKDSADGSLRADLLKRLTGVETDLGEARKAFDSAMNAARREFDDALNSERRECARQLGAYQRKMDVVTRRFFQFQLSLVRYLPADAGPTAQAAVDSILGIISQPIEDFEEVAPV